MFKTYSLLAGCMALAAVASATFTPVTLTGFNQDVIANGVGGANTSTTAAVDGSDFAFLAPDFRAIAGNPLPAASLPASGLINSVMTSGLTFQLANYTGNNALVLTAANSSGTLTFGTPYSGDVYVLGMAGNGPATANITVNFADATTQVFNNISFPDWYYQPDFAIKGFGRIGRASNTIEAPADDPRLYQPKLTLSAGNYGKQIVSITVVKATAAGTLNILGVSVCRVPTVATQPVNRALCENDNTAFSMTGSNIATYQWQVNTGSPASFVDVTNNATYSGATTATLTLTNTPASFNNYTYRCVITSACGATTNTAARTLTVKPKLVITSQTTTAVTCTKGMLTMGVNHAGNALSYQWEMEDPSAGGGYTPVLATFPYVGANTNQLTVLSADDILNGVKFRCQVLGDCNSLTSAEIPVTILPAPYFTRHPQDLTIYKGEGATFSAAIGGSNFEVYWQASDDGGVQYVNLHDNQLYANTNKTHLEIRQVLPAFEGWKFRCIMKSVDPLCNTLRDTSDAGTLHILYATSVAGMDKDAAFSVYPNPVQDGMLYIQAANNYAQPVQATVIDAMGRVVYAKEISFATDKHISLPAEVPAGLYYLKLNSNELSQTLNFIKR
jgi:hypothetical protein